MSLQAYLQQQNLTQADTQAIQQHTRDYCTVKGIDAVLDEWHTDCTQTAQHTAQHKNSRDIMYDSWEIDDYVDSVQFKAYVLSMNLSLPALTRNQLMLDVLRG